MNELFDATVFTPRGQCDGWTQTLGAIYRVANLGIALAFFAIPCALAYLYDRKRDDMPSPRSMLLFITFIAICGVGHTCDFLAFYWPAYRLFTLIDIVTAFVSLLTAATLPVVIGNYLERSAASSVLSAEIAELRASLVEARSIIDDLLAGQRQDSPPEKHS